MIQTLYSRLIEYDYNPIGEVFTSYPHLKEDKRLIEISKDLKRLGDNAQRDLLTRSESNPVFYDAVQGKMSIEDSLSELSKVNQGIYRVLPRFKNKAHNERLKNLGELIRFPHQLRTGGVAIFDNLIGGAAMGGVILATTNELMKYILINNSVSPVQIDESKSMIDIIVLGYSVFAVPLGAAITHSLGRTGELPFKEAKYIDSKIKEFY